MKRRLFIVMVLMSLLALSMANATAQDTPQEYDFIVLDAARYYTPNSDLRVEVIFRQKNGSWRIRVRKCANDSDWEEFACLVKGDDVTMLKDKKGVWRLIKAPTCS